MITKLEENLYKDYLIAFEILKERQIDNNSSECLLLALIIKEDSLLNCLAKIDLEDALKIILENKENFKKNENDNLIEKAFLIAMKDNMLVVGDEHLLSALINAEESNAFFILSLLNTDIEKIRICVNNYFEFENDEYLINLTNLARMNKFDPFIGKENIIDKVIRIIYKKQKNNCLLIGSAGVGKSALVEGVVMKLIEIESDLTLYRLDVGVIIAGTRYRGDLEERLTQVIKKIKEEKAILFIDEIHNIIGNSKNEDNLNLANILKPILARSEIKCIGATTLDEYYEYFYKDRALARRFQNIFIPEATKEETFKILENIKTRYEDFYNIKYSKTIIKEIINNCIFFPNRKFPDKAIDILDETGSLCVSLKKKVPQKKDVKQVVFESIGLDNNKYKIKTYKELQAIYQIFTIGLEDKKTICNINYIGENKDHLINEVKLLFNIRDEAVVNIDFELFDENAYNYLISSCLKYPLCCVVVTNYEKANYYFLSKINKIFETGRAYDQNGRIVLFRNVIFILTQKNLKEVIGFNNEVIKNDIFDLTISDNQIIKNNSLNAFLKNMKNNNIDISVDLKTDEKINLNLLLNNFYKIYKPQKKYIITKEHDKILLKENK